MVFNDNIFRGRALRIAFGTLLVFFIFAGGAGALSSIAGGSQAYSHQINITLITGDTVAVHNISGQVSYSILPGKTGISRAYQIMNSPRGTYLVPGGIDLDKVDMELFNVDYLVREDYVNLSFIPIMTTFDPVPGTKKGNASSIAGMNFTGINKGINILRIDNKLGIATAIIDKEETGGAFNALLENDKVSKIWLDKKMHVSLSDSVPLIGAPALWGQGYNGSGIKIAVIDTGIDATHPDLDDIDDNTPTNDPKVLVQKNFVDWTYSDISDDTTNDLYGHGTHVASTAAGTGEASAGVYKGVAPGAYLWNLRVLNKYGSGYESWIIDGINYAAYGADGISNSGDEADIISMSLGGGATDGNDPMSIAVNNAVDAGVVVIIAAGNSGSDFTIGTPGAADKVITVGATDKSDILAYFSSRGPILDYRVKPDVVAPGVDIIAARASGTTMGNPVNEYYTSASGTSMATPHVAGAAALLLEKGVPAGLSKPDYVKNVLISSAKDLDLSVYKQGGGRIQVLEASKAQVIPDQATLSFKIITGINKSVITFNNLNTTSSRTLFVDVAVKDTSGSIVNAASLNTTSLAIAPNSSASVLLTVDATSIPRSIYSGKVTAVADNGEKVGVIFGFAKMNELIINKIKFDGRPAVNEFVWVFETNAISGDSFSRFVTTDLNGTATVMVPDGDFNIWSGSFFNDTWIWTTKDKLSVTGDISTILDERLSLPVSFDPNKPNQKFAAVSSNLYSEDLSHGYGLLSYYPLNTTIRFTPTPNYIGNIYEFYPDIYYDFSDPNRINTNEWHKLYFSEHGINSPRNYLVDYSKLVKRTGVYKTALINESAYRGEFVSNKSFLFSVYITFDWLMDLPQQRIEYLTPDTYYWGLFFEQDFNWYLSDNFFQKSYPVASTPIESWNEQPFSWSHNLYMGPNWLSLYGSSFMDTGKHMYGSSPVPCNFTLYRNGTKIYNISTNSYFNYYNSSEPDTASYSAVIEGASNQNLSERSRTVLNFSYTGSGDYKPPKISWQIPNLDMYNRLPGNNLEINLSVVEENESGFVNGTPDQLSGMTLEYSINEGAAWNTLMLNSHGNGEYNATISGLPNNAFVSLRTKAIDTSGNSASHEVIKAFLINAPTGTTPPVADCGADKLRCENVGAPVQFNGSASYDPDGVIVSYNWDFGDGTNGTGVALTHKYSTYRWNGTAYQPISVNLTVMDNDGMMNSTSQKVVIWIAGDANGDGKVNILDAALVGLKWNSNPADPCADLNNDGKVNILDASIIGLNWGKIPIIQ